MSEFHKQRKIERDKGGPSRSSQNPLPDHISFQVFEKVRLGPKLVLRSQFFQSTRYCLKNRQSTSFGSAHYFPDPPLRVPPDGSSHPPNPDLPESLRTPHLANRRSLLTAPRLAVEVELDQAAVL